MCPDSEGDGVRPPELAQSAGESGGAGVVRVGGGVKACFDGGIQVEPTLLSLVFKELHS